MTLTLKLYFYCSNCQLNFDKAQSGTSCCPRCHDAVCNACGLTESELKPEMPNDVETITDGFCVNCHGRQNDLGRESLKLIPKISPGFT